MKPEIIGSLLLAVGSCSELWRVSCDATLRLFLSSQKGVKQVGTKGS